MSLGLILIIILIIFLLGGFSGRPGSDSRQRFITLDRSLEFFPRAGEEKMQIHSRGASSASELC